jgi:hypothetical protein
LGENQFGRIFEEYDFSIRYQKSIQSRESTIVVLKQNTQFITEIKNLKSSEFKHFLVPMSNELIFLTLG